MRRALSGLLLAATLVVLATQVSLAQEKPPVNAHVVAENPTAIESASLVFEAVAKPQTVQFKETSLSEVADWIKDKTGLNVVLDHRSLEAANILPSEPITDALDNAAMYLLLDRLANQQIQWNAVGGIITLHAADDHRAAYAVQYNVGELLDAKFKGDELVDMIKDTVDPDGWDANHSSAVLLGDILFCANRLAIIAWWLVC